MHIKKLFIKTLTNFIFSLITIKENKKDVIQRSSDV